MFSVRDADSHIKHDIKHAALLSLVGHTKVSNDFPFWTVFNLWEELQKTQRFIEVVGVRSRLGDSETMH